MNCVFLPPPDCGLGLDLWTGCFGLQVRLHVRLAGMDGVPPDCADLECLLWLQVRLQCAVPDLATADDSLSALNTVRSKACSWPNFLPLSNSKASREGLTSRPGVASVQQARTNFRRCTRPCKVPVSNNIWLLSLLCDECCQWGLAGAAGAMNCNGLFFGRSCVPVAARGPGRPGQPSGSRLWTWTWLFWAACAAASAVPDRASGWQCVASKAASGKSQ